MHNVTVVMHCTVLGFMLAAGPSKVALNLGRTSTRALSLAPTYVLSVHHLHAHVMLYYLREL
jgi:hypothetical protein